MLKIKQTIPYIVPTVVGLLILALPTPEGVREGAITAFAVFVFTILGIIFKPLPMGAISLLGLALMVISRTKTLPDALGGFSNEIVWLIVLAFFIARGFIKTGLGMRIAYHLIRFLGKTTIGLGYGIVFADALLAPTIPSNTARSGGVIYPIIASLSRAFDSHPHKHRRKIGAFLIQVAFQGVLVTGGMFLTSMAGNPLIADIVRENGVDLSWGRWALAAIVPGIASLMLIPLLVYKLFPPELRKTPEAQEFALGELAKLGSLRRDEKIMLGVFLLLIILWMSGPYIYLSPTTTALIGLLVLLITKVLTWEDITTEKEAWNTLVWFSVLIMLAGTLKSFGLTDWFGHIVASQMGGMPWSVSLILLSLVYYYSHYFFASNVAHIGSMYAPFFLITVSLGAPPLVAAMTLAIISSLYGGLTQYGCGPAPILFGSGYVTIKEWWRLGFCMSIAYIIVLFTVGMLWWKVLGLY